MKRLARAGPLLVLLLAAISSFAQVPPPSISGSLTAQDSGACSTAGACLVLQLQGNSGASVIQVTGTFSATAQFEGLPPNSTTWSSVAGTPLGGGSAVTSVTGTGAWGLNVSGLAQVRVRVSTYASGTVGVTISSSAAAANSRGGGGGGGGGSGTVTSVALAMPSFIAVSGSPVTSSGTITGAYATGLTSNESQVLGVNSSGAAGIYGISSLAQALTGCNIAGNVYTPQANDCIAGNGTTTNALTLNNGGSGAASGSTFNGSSAVTLSYNTIGASPLAGSSSLTTVGTIGSGTWHGTAITPAYGGTGLTSFTLYNLLIGNGTSNATLLAPSATSGLPLCSQGASSNPAYCAVNVGNSSVVTGQLGISNGGTGTSSPSLVAGTGISITGSWPNQTVTASGSLTNPMTSVGDMIIGGSSGAATRLAGPTGPNGVPEFLTSTPSGGVAASQTYSLAGVTPNAQTGTTYTIAVTDRTGYVTFSNSSSIAVTLPQAGGTGFANNFAFRSCDIGTGTATIAPTTSTISYTTGGAYTSGASSMALTTGQCASIYSDNSNYFANVTTGGSQVFPGAGIAVSTGSGWGTSLTAPSGTIVGTSDTQTLTNKSIAASEINSGTLACAQLPALTGDTTSSSGSCATTTAKINGTAYPASAACIGSNSSSQPVSCSGIPNADLANSATTVDNATCTLGSSCAPYHSCTELWGGTGTSNALQSGDDAIADNGCYNDSGHTWTVTAVKCRSDNASNTTTVNPAFGSAGSGTSILSGALTCGNSLAYSSTGTVSNASVATGNGINPVMGGTLTGTSIAMIVEYHY